MAQIKVDGIKEQLLPICDQVGISHQDVEICISESPASHWGFRGLPGDEAPLNYKIEV